MIVFGISKRRFLEKMLLTKMIFRKAENYVSSYNCSSTIYGIFDSKIPMKISFFEFEIILIAIITSSIYRTGLTYYCGSLRQGIHWLWELLPRK